MRGSCAATSWEFFIGRHTERGLRKHGRYTQAWQTHVAKRTNKVTETLKENTNIAERTAAAVTCFSPAVPPRIEMRITAELNSHRGPFHISIDVIKSARRGLVSCSPPCAPNTRCKQISVQCYQCCCILYTNMCRRNIYMYMCLLFLFFVS